jgi:hypothetical protein
MRWMAFTTQLGRRFAWGFKGVEGAKSYTVYAPRDGAYLAAFRGFEGKQLPPELGGYKKRYIIQIGFVWAMRRCTAYEYTPPPAAAGNVFGGLVTYEGRGGPRRNGAAAAAPAPAPIPPMPAYPPVIGLAVSPPPLLPSTAAPPAAAAPAVPATAASAAGKSSAVAANRVGAVAANSAGAAPAASRVGLLVATNSSSVLAANRSSVAVPAARPPSRPIGTTAMMLRAYSQLTGQQRAQPANATSGRRRLRGWLLL